MKIIGLGNALVDLLVRLENEELLSKYNLPRGSMTLVDRRLSNQLNAETSRLDKSMASGGSAANTIHGLAKLGIETSYVGKIGEDELGRFFEKDMLDAGIQPVLYHSLNDTGRVMGLISPDSERTMATYLGAAVELSAGDISFDLLKGFNYLYIEGYLINNQELFLKALNLGKETGLKVAIDLASFNVVEFYREVLLNEVAGNVDIIFANEEEAKALTGKEPEDAVNEIAGMCDIAVVKTGAKGSIVRQGNKVFQIEALKVKSVDTTGAGDSYAAGFLYGLVKNMDLEKSARIGTLLASEVIQVIGPKLGDRTWDLIRETISQF